MELKDFIKVLSKSFKASLTLGLVFAAIALVFAFMVPNKYKASANLFVTRQAEQPNDNYFTYEGYYAGQTAEKYTDTVIGLLKSPEMKRKALEVLGKPFTNTDVISLERNIVVKRTGPQLIYFSIIGMDSNYVQEVWMSLARSVITQSTQLNVMGDAGLSIDIVDEKPIVSKVTANPFTLSAGAFLLGVFLVVFTKSFKSYMKG